MKQRTSLYDTLKIEGKTWYAIGEYSDTALGKKYAENEAHNIRTRGGKARLVTRKTGIQVYGNEKKYVFNNK
jgi:hypothetical protein